MAIVSSCANDAHTGPEHDDAGEKEKRFTFGGGRHGVTIPRVNGEYIIESSHGWTKERERRRGSTRHMFPCHASAIPTTTRLV